MQPNTPKPTSPAQERDNASFLNNPQQETARTKSNLLQMPSVTLPKGGGAMKSIDEKFSVNAANGTAAYSIPLPFSPTSRGATPALTLSYNSGGGNSVFGLGWDIDLPSIQRKSDKKLPEYKDAEESDVFLLAGAEDLVPELRQDVNGKWLPYTYHEGTATVQSYRLRMEGSFARIEKVSDGANVYWRVRSRENVVSVFGRSPEARIANPATGKGDNIFRWFLEYSYDDKGNYIAYRYKQENSQNITPSLSEKNRLNRIAPFANAYLKRVCYGNTTPFYEGDVPPTDFLFELVLDYGEHDAVVPTTAEKQQWSVRSDAFSDYKAGFDIRTYRLCRRVLMFHHFSAELGKPDYLVRSLLFGYDERPHLTYVDSITLSGYIWNKDGSLKSKRSLPPLQFTYSKPVFSNTVRELPYSSMEHDPTGLSSGYQWTDLYSEGISGILSEQATGWHYKENLGNGVFSPAKLISPKPSFSGLAEGSLSIQELEANGKKYLVAQRGAMKGYFSLWDDQQDTTNSEAWQAFRPFDNFPVLDLQDPNLKFIDLNGDGMPDMLLSREQDFIWYAANGIAGYDDYHLAARVRDAERGPQILFSDSDDQMLIATADMSGDGLADIVLITHSNVCYYPNLGYGRFGAKVSMEMQGAFDSANDFNPRFIHLADIDGSGTTDIIYTAKGKVQVRWNQSGNKLSDPWEFLNPFPQIDSATDITFVDLLGNGTSCMVWSSPLPAHINTPLRYIDLTDGKKPHLMTEHKNNMGQEVRMEYRSSTQYYLDDKKQGRPWISKLPFPVHCVNKVIIEDKVSRTRFSNEYSYHHGYYDSVEREFRGFARVEQRDSEVYEHYVQETLNSGAVNSVEKDFFQPVVLTKSWFHTGVFLNRRNTLHFLEEEYYPKALINNGSITDAAVIAALASSTLPEVPLPHNLSTEELIEHCRALKGLPLRQEVYSEEGEPSIQVHPYTTSQYNYHIQMLQPKGKQRHAVFLSHERESLVCQYERNPADPRISHSMNIEIDRYGNVLQSASVVYGRKKADMDLPTAKDRSKQTEQHILYSTNGFTLSLDTATAYRLPLACESQTWELNAAAPTAALYTPEEILQHFSNASSKLYEEQCATGEKRKIEHSKTLFLKNNLNGALPLGVVESLALPYESYLLAFTPSLLQHLYNGKHNESLLRNKGRYLRSEGDDNYWIASGRVYFHPNLSASPYSKSIAPPTAADVDFAKKNFYLPIAYQDTFGYLTKVFYDKYKLLTQRVIDAADNEVTADAINYRTLAPYLLRDANNNRSGVRFDELGLVTHTFVMGKESAFKGDPMDTTSLELSLSDKPTSVMEYEFRYHSSGGAKPNRVKTKTRERHHYKEKAPSEISGGVSKWLETLFGSGAAEVEGSLTWQEQYAYSDGSGHEVLTKVQAEPGLAPQRDGNGVLQRDVQGNVINADTTPNLRWIGNGRTIYNNKGNAVKQYEPFFDSSPEYTEEKELVEIGVTPLLRYDALGRRIRTDFPNGTFSKVEFDAWKQKEFDANDTVQESAWYTKYSSGNNDEKDAAAKAALHHNTPTLTYLDSLGRAFLVIAHNKTQRSNEAAATEEHYYTRTELDIEGNARNISDARNNVVMSWKYDMLGNICYQHSMDAGNRWMLADSGGRALRLWDSRAQIFGYDYDELHRPLALTVDDGSGERIFEKFLYGETIPDARLYNLRAQLYRHSDTAGEVTTLAYDFKGNALVSTRRLLKDYQTMPDWKGAPPLETQTYTKQSFFDALSRVQEVVEPDKTIVSPQYNAGALLERLNVRVGGIATITPFVRNIDYNAKGQRERILYDNGTETTYSYEKETYRLTHLLTKAGATVLQNLHYTYDPVGNITRQFDAAQKTVFYGGSAVNAQSDYYYDAVYRLVEAIGREHIGQVGFGIKDNWKDDWCTFPLAPNSAVQMRSYTQRYYFDAVGNIESMKHDGGVNGSWTRLYSYNTGDNHLTQTRVSNGTDNFSYPYTYNEHGSMKTMPHLQAIDWNFREEMQHINLGGGGDAWYNYDASGQRVRKVVKRLGAKRTERIYMGSVEIYREYNGAVLELERQTLHISDNKQRVAMVETRTEGTDPSPVQLTRYQYNNHLGSASLELDNTAKIISYEEYHPYGTTAYSATDSTRQVPAKRYRYTGMERDEESGLNYHTARYYAPWLGRWTAADPIGIGGGINLYAYVNANPITRSDTRGTDGEVCGVYDEEALVCRSETCQPVTVSPEVSATPAAAGRPATRIRRQPRRTPPPAPEPLVVFTPAESPDSPTPSWEQIRQTEVAQGAGGLTTGTLSALIPGGFLLAPALEATGRYETPSRTFRFFHHAGEFITGVAQIFGGVGGEAVGTTLDAAGVAGAPESFGASLALTSLGVSINVASWGLILQGASNLSVGAAGMYNAAMMSDNSSGGGSAPPPGGGGSSGGGGRAPLRRQAEQAGVREEIEGEFEVVVHGTERQSAEALIETQGGRLTTSGGNFQGRFFGSATPSVAEVFAARTVSRVGGETSLVGIAIPSRIMNNLRQSRLVRTQDVFVNGQRIGTETIFESGAIEFLQRYGFFFRVQ